MSRLQRHGGDARPSPADLRAAVYTDYAYHRVGEGIQAERAFALFIGALSERIGRLVLVGRLDPDPEGGRYPVGDRIDFHPLPHYESLARPWDAIRGMARSLGRLWRALDGVDCVWLLGPHPLALPFAAMAVLRRRRVFLGVRQDFPRYVRSRRPGRRWLNATAWALELSFRALARVCPVVVVGPGLREAYRRSPRLLEIAVSLVREEDVVPARLSGGRSYEGELTVLSVGRLDAEKNPMILVDILAELNRERPRWRLVVCGEGPMEGELRVAFEQAGLGEGVELRGYVPHDRLRDLYRGSHAFLHVSLTEGLPQVLFEAFAAGLPVVATDVGGVRAAVDGAARLVAPADPAAAVEELRRIASEAPLREALRDAGRELALAHTIEGESRSLAEFMARCSA